MKREQGRTLVRTPATERSACSVAGAYAGNGEERLLRPRHEPVDDRIVHHARKGAAADSKSLPDWRHCEDDVEVVAALANKVIPNALFRVEGTTLDSLVADVADDAVFL